MNFDFRNLYNSAVQHFPDNNAIFINGDYYTYAALQQQVEVVVEIIKKEGLVNKNIAIAVSEDNHILSIASIIAVFQTGNVLLPFNKHFPAERNLYAFRQVQPQLILSLDADKHIETCIDKLKGYAFSWFTFSDSSFKRYTKEYIANTSLDGIAYILYTSGSTGKPKGVPVSFKNLNNCLHFFYTQYPFQYTDRFLQVYTTTFDVFYFSLLMPLTVGGCCYFIENATNSVKYLEIFSALKLHQITVVSMVPTLLMYVEKYFYELSFPDLRYSFFSGDALLHSIAEQWIRCLPNGEIHNFYGPTETTIVCTRYIWEKNKSLQESYNNIVPIGYPFPKMDYLIVDELNRPVPNKSIGELVFSGPQVINSYIDKGFVERFFVEVETGKRFYKTGDLVLLNENGTLIFVGRKDFQVKINGYRVELAEVEAQVSAITKNPCYAFVKPNKKGLNVLYVAVLDNQIEEKDVIRTLKSILPPYMIPYKFLKVDSFPTNTNQKIDRLLLRQLIND
mgnify:FL=1